jgi:hypothetical protein
VEGVDEKQYFFVDQRAKELEELIATEAESPRAAQSIAEQLDRAHGGDSRPADGLAGQEAAAYLNKLIEALSQDISSRASGYSPARWLWYLRRLPDSLFKGTYSTTSGYDRALAETLSWFSRRSELSATLPPSFGFRVDVSAAKHLLAFVFSVRLLSHLHAIYRRVGKGAGLFFENRVPFAEQNDSVGRAIRIYDERHEKRQFDQAALGVVGPLADVTTPRSDRESQVFLFARCGAIQVPINAPHPDGRMVPGAVTARHIYQAIPIQSFLKPYSADPDVGLPYLNQIEPLIVLQTMFPLLCVDLPVLLGGSLQVGYGVVSLSRLERVVSSWLPPLREQLLDIAPTVDWSRDFQEWFARMKAIKPQVWPSKPGGCIREAADAVVLDFTAASTALLQLSAIDRSNFKVANVRAETFELQVQGIINLSRWRPGAELAALRGRPLRRSGLDVTDIDAIGVCDGELFLVSCKSLVYDAEYDRGTHRVVANAGETVDNAVADWLRFITDLDAAPCGDNFDFTPYRGRIIGVVCTPFVVYSYDAETLAFVRPGLRRCAAAFEIRSWLDRDVRLR